MKNSIPENEYILITDPFELDISSIEMDKKEWISIERGSNTYDSLGELAYSYIPIKPLLKDLDKPSQISFPELGSNKIFIEDIFLAPIDFIYENFTDLDKRKNWNEDIKEIISHEKP